MNCCFTLEISKSIRVDGPDLVVVHVEGRQLRHAAEHAGAEVADVVVVQNQLIQIIQT
jgi:hypothetical protein